MGNEFLMELKIKEYAFSEEQRENDLPKQFETKKTDKNSNMIGKRQTIPDQCFNT